VVSLASLEPLVSQGRPDHLVAEVSRDSQACAVIQGSRDPPGHLDRRDHRALGATAALRAPMDSKDPEERREQPGIRAARESTDSQVYSLLSLALDYIILQRVSGLVRCTTFAVFVYWRIVPIKRRRSSSGDVNKFCFYAIKL